MYPLAVLLGLAPDDATAGPLRLARGFLAAVGGLPLATGWGFGSRSSDFWDLEEVLLGVWLELAGGELCLRSGGGTGAAASVGLSEAGAHQR